MQNWPKHNSKHILSCKWLNWFVSSKFGPCTLQKLSKLHFLKFVKTCVLSCNRQGGMTISKLIMLPGNTSLLCQDCQDGMARS